MKICKIFASMNEKGINKADWLASLPIGAKAITRRTKKLNIGDIISIKKTRTGKALLNKNGLMVLYKITGGMWHKDWRIGFEFDKHLPTNWAHLTSTDYKLKDRTETLLKREAKLEGFETIKGWLDWYPKHKIDINKTWRICMERIQ